MRLERDPQASLVRHSVAGLALVFVLLLQLPTAAPADTSRAQCDEAPIVVKIHADWCQTCKGLEPVWKLLAEEYADRIRFVELDVTDRIAFQKSKSAADELGLKEFFAEHRSQTGTVAILDCNSLEPVSILAGERDPAKYREAIAKADHSS